MTRVRVPIAFTRIDRWLIGLGLLATGAIVALVWLSQVVVAPPRPKISGSARPMVGLALRAAPEGVLVIRASGPAREGGLRAGDRIVRCDDDAGPTVPRVAERVRASREGESLTFEARRGTPGPDETTVLAEVRVVVRRISPADEGLPYDDVSFRNADGLTLRGWYIPPPSSGSGRAPAIAYGHGNGTDRRQWLPVASAVHDAGFAQLLFDFTGRGESDGEVITLGWHEAQDLRAALDLLTARPEIDPMRLAIGGRSMGAVAALFEAADDARVRALVLDSPYADLARLVDRTLAGYHIPAAIVRPLLLAVAGWRANYAPADVRPVEAIAKVRVPVLLFHGDKDTLVPFEDARALERAAGGRVTLVPLPGLDHNTPRPDEAQARMVAFLSSALAR